MRPASPQVLLQNTGLHAFIASDPLNLRYLTGLQMSTGLLLATERRFTLFVDARYAEAAKKEAHTGIEVRDIAELPKVLEKGGKCGFEADHVTVSRLRGWKKRFPKVTFMRTEGLVEEFRREKDDEEIRLLKRAEKLTKELLRRVPGTLRGTLTERALAWKLQVWAQELGADRLSFDPIVAFGANTSRPHHQPSARTLKKGDIVQIDVGAVYRGYCADMSEVYFTRKPTPEHERAYRALLQAKDDAVAAIKPGASTVRIDEAARKILRAYGYEENFTHALGHGVGLDVHEGVTIGRTKKGEKLLAGEVVTIEPGIYFPGKFGMRLEDMVFVGL